MGPAALKEPYHYIIYYVRPSLSLLIAIRAGSYTARDVTATGETLYLAPRKKTLKVKVLVSIVVSITHITVSSHIVKKNILNREPLALLHNITQAHA